MNDKQKAALDRRIDRSLARRGDEDYKLSVFIRIGESDLYDYEPTVRAVLKEIAYMAVKDDIKGIGHPAGRENVDYEGWCYAKQKTLALRVGCDEDTVQKAATRLVKDGVLHKRTYRDKYKRLHCEYKVIESAVDARKRTGERKPAGRKAPKTAFKKKGADNAIDKTSDKFVGETHPALDRMAPGVVPGEHPALDREDIRSGVGRPSGIMSEKGGSLVRPSGGLREGGSVSTPPSGLAEEPSSLRSANQNQNPAQVGARSRTYPKSLLTPEIADALFQAPDEEPAEPRRDFDL